MPTVPSTSHGVLPRLSTLESHNIPSPEGGGWNTLLVSLCSFLCMCAFPITAHPILLRRPFFCGTATGQLTWVKLCLTLIFWIVSYKLSITYRHLKYISTCTLTTPNHNCAITLLMALFYIHFLSRNPSNKFVIDFFTKLYRSDLSM